MTQFNSLTNIFILILFFTVCTVSGEWEQCEKQDEYRETNGACSKHWNFSRKRYILYDVNPPEGFNLRRDVYIRAAIFVKNLAQKDKEFVWHLVLPPWGSLYHWRSTTVNSQRRLPWGTFFDVASLQKFAPVIEMHEFQKEYPSERNETTLDLVYILQNDEEMFETGRFEDKNELVECPTKGRVLYEVSGPNKHRGRFWGYSNVTAKDVKCLIFHGTMSGLEQNLNPQVYSSVMFDHMEIPLHDSYGTKEYWTARRSMRYNSGLYDIAANFRKTYLDSDDFRDNTERPADWTQEKAKRDALGGPYLCVHLRRRDFLTGRASSVPTLESAASQLRKKMEGLRLTVIFVATDAEEDEFEELQEYLPEYTVLRYAPLQKTGKKLKDGEVAVIDQIICSNARYFIGTHESTFTFRIQEDREIIGFPASTTFNRLCGKEKKCKPGGRWEIVW